VERAFDPLEDLADIVEVQAGAKIAEVSGLHGEPPAHARCAGHGQAPTDCLVHGLAERAVGLPGFSPQFRGHIVIEREGRSHIMMLAIEHHDVNEDSAEERPGGAGRMIAATALHHNLTVVTRNTRDFHHARGQ
jgi:hypothetical protein